MNLIDLDLLAINQCGKYTRQELEFNKIASLIEDAKLRSRTAISTSIRVLTPFGLVKERC